MSYTGYLIPANPMEPMRRVEIANIDELSAAIDCRVFDCLSVRPDVDFWLDDEGRLVAEPQFNARASVLFDWEMTRQRGFSAGAQIFGNVVVTGGVDDEGNTVSISENRLTEYATFVAELYA